MTGTVPIPGSLTLQELADKLNRHEQLGSEQVTGLGMDPTHARNLLTTIAQAQQLKPLVLCTAGTDTPGDKILSATVYVVGVATDIDVYRST